MQSKRWLLWIVLAGLVARVAAWMYFHAHTLELVTMRLPDDALYYFAIAHNVATGNGISFDGIHSTNGMHPLWVVLLTPIFWLDLSKWGYIHAALLLESLLDVITIWLIGSSVYHALHEQTESNRRTAAGVAALIYALSAIVLLQGINGMETTLTALFFVLWFQSFLRTWSRNGWADWIGLGIVTGGLLLARTDSFIVLIPISLYLVLTRWQAAWLRMLLALVVAGVVIAPWLWWNVSTFGTIMQSSGEAVPLLAFRKLHALYGPSITGHLLWEALRNFLKPFWYAAFGLPLVTIAYAIVDRQAKLSSHEPASYLLVLGGMLLLVVHSLFRGFIREWYVVELIPLYLIALGVSSGANAGSSEARSAGRWTLAGVIIVLQAVLYLKPTYPSQAAMLKSGIPLTRKLTERSNVATFNSGYYGYFEEHPGRIVNMDGVVNSGALRALQTGTLSAYLDRDSVQYILDFRGDFGGYVNLFDRHLLNDFVLDSTILNQYDSSDPLVLYRRSDVIGQKEMTN